MSSLAREETGRVTDGAGRIVLEGCAPTPLSDYLKGLAVLRLVAEQVDPEARGHWERDRFVLTSSLDREALTTFLLRDYRPTPILAPWNGGSGFYPKDKGVIRRGMGPIERGGAWRFAHLRETIAVMRDVLAELGLGAKPDDKSSKLRLLTLLRATLDEEALKWLDAAVLLAEDDPRYPPLLGTGGNDGRLDFTGNFLQNLVTLFDPVSGAAREGTARLLNHALFATPSPALESTAIGQFSPGAAGGPNAATAFEGESLVNPWDFVLMLEGALLFAATATRRLEATGGVRLSYPFTVRASAVGNGGTDLTDEHSARGEIWLPLWGAPASLAELQALFGEGRATIGRRAARDGLDFARAVARLGVGRGIDEFQRYGFLQRYGRTYLATALNRITVHRNPTADLIDQLEHRDWLRRFRRLAHGEETPARLASLGRRLDDSLFELALYGRDSPRSVQEVLIAVGQVMRYLAVSPSARERCPPVPRLEANWVRAADDATAEFRIALALAGIHAIRRTDAGSTSAYPLGVHLAPIEEARRGAWREEAAHDVVWTSGPVEASLRRVLVRRLVVAQADPELVDRPLAGWSTAPLHAVATWLSGRLDTVRMHRLLVGLALARVPRRLPLGTASPESPAPLPAAYRVLKIPFCTNEQLRRVGILEAGESLPLPLHVVRQVAAGRVARAVNSMSTRLRAAGFVLPRYIDGGFPEDDRLLAALLVPIGDRDLARAARPMLARSDTAPVAHSRDSQEDEDADRPQPTP